MPRATIKNITLTLGKLGITKAVHLWEPNGGSWRSFDDKMARVRGITPELRALTAQFLIVIQEANTVIEEKLTDPDIWRWSNDLPTNGRFMLINQQTYLLLLKEYSERQTLNTRWGRSDIEQIWTKRWKIVWGSDLTRQAKMFL